MPTSSDASDADNGMKPRGDPRALLELHVSTVLLAAPALFAQLLPLHATTIIAARSFVATGCVALVAMVFRRSLRPANRRALLGMLSAGVCLGLHWVTYFHAVQVSTVAVGMVALFCYPLLTAVLEPVLGTGPWHARQLISAAAVIVAVVIMAGAPTTDPGAPAGTLWGLVSAACLALRNVLSRRAAQSSSAWQLAFYQYGVACLCAAGLGWQDMGSAREHAPLLLLLGIGFTAVPHTLFIRSLAVITATRAALVACLQPLYAALLALVVLGEQPSVATMLGGGIVLAVAAMASRSR